MIVGISGSRPESFSQPFSAAPRLAISGDPLRCSADRY